MGSVGLNIGSQADVSSALGGDLGGDLASNESYNLGENLVVPDPTQVNLPGQFASMPGGANINSGIATPDGNAIYTDPNANATPTGGYLSALASVAASASKAMTTFIAGSPSVAIPAAKIPQGKTVGGGFLTTSTGATNWTTVGIIVVVGIVGLVVLAKYV